MRLSNEILLNKGNASGNLISNQGLVAHVFGCTVQAIVEGSATGSLKLQGSNDPVPDASFKVVTFPVANWIDITDAVAPINGTGAGEFELADVFYNWIRAVYTAGSGTGTLTIQLNTKGF